MMSKRFELQHPMEIVSYQIIDSVCVYVCISQSCIYSSASQTLSDANKQVNNHVTLCL